MRARKIPKSRCLPDLTPRMRLAAYSGDVRALNVQCDGDYQGKTFKICNVIDEFTREHGRLEVGRSITATAVTNLRQNFAAARGGRLRMLHMDNEP